MHFDGTNAFSSNLVARIYPAFSRTSPLVLTPASNKCVWTPPKTSLPHEGQQGPGSAFTRGLQQRRGLGSSSEVRRELSSCVTSVGPTSAINLQHENSRGRHVVDSRWHPNEGNEAVPRHVTGYPVKRSQGGSYATTLVNDSCTDGIGDPNRRHADCGSTRGHGGTLTALCPEKH